MSVFIRGNHSQYIRGRQPQGIGAASKTNGIGWMELFGKTGDIVYITADELLPMSAVDTPIHFQTVNGSATAWFTLVNPALSCQTSPSIQVDNWWANETTINPGEIIAAPIINFITLKIEFTSDTALYIAGR